MREILFRGKRIADGKWMYGLPSYDEYGNIEEIQVWDGEDISFCLVDPETICQYTGLTDKNGKKIWEGDIVQEKYYPYHVYKVVLDKGNGGWTAEYQSVPLYSIGCATSKKYKVIGNVFDNPELLEV